MSESGKEAGVGMKDKLILFFIVTLISICVASIIANGQINDDDRVEVYFFFDKGCPHCAQEKPFLMDMEEKYPRLNVNYFDVEEGVNENQALFEEFCERYNTFPAGVPRTFVGDKVFVGFSPEDCDLVWYHARKAYVGCPNQVENAIRQLMNLSAMISKTDAMEIARKNCFVCDLTSSCGDAIANIAMVDDIYLVAWWTPERVKSDLNYPNVLVKVDAKTGEIISAEVPDSVVEGLVKPPLDEPDYLLIAIAVLMVFVPITYMVVGSHLQRRYWISISSLLLIIFIFAYFKSLPSMNLVAYAKQFSFPVFTFIIALADGFNPCAFAVLAFLLSILTHTKSRRKMLLIGSIFILTSGFAYFLFIVVAVVVYNLLIAYKGVIQITLASVAIIAGLINLKDFFFKKGISLTMSAEKQSKVFKKIGKLVRKVEQARSKQDMLFAAIATIALAAMVNLVELGCTAILPTQYILVLEANYAREDIIYLAYIAFYSAVYTIPLFAILGSFIYSFKSERLTKTQGRILKLVGGLIMLSLGLILIFKPELLMFGG